MAATTLAQARTAVRELIDAPTTARFSDANIDSALTMGLDGCLTRYCRSGDRFDLYTTGTTSATDGTLSLSSVSPLMVKELMVVVGSTTSRIPQKNRPVRGYLDAVARSVSVLYVREYALSSTSSDPLVGVAAVAANTWPAFDNWVCARAATLLQVKDAEDRADLIAHANMLEREVMSRSGSPQSYSMPRAEWSPVVEGLSWQWTPATTTVSLVRVAA